MWSTIQERTVETGSIAPDTSARAAEINCKPPRISPLQPEEVSDDAWIILNKVRGAISSKPAENLPESSGTVMRHPDLFRAHMELGFAFFNGALLPRDREFVIIRTAWLCQAPFQFGQHVKIGKRVSDLTSDEVDRIVVGSSAPEWNVRDRAMLRAVDELHARAMISDETWAVLAEYFNEKQLIELPLLVGQYQGVAYLYNALRIRMDPDNAGLSAR